MPAGLESHDGFVRRAERALLRQPEPPRQPGDVILGDHRIAGFAPDMERINNAVEAAVLVPVTFDEPGGRIILTERSHKLRKHAGQVAFPGGRVDPGETALESALREAEEEINLDRSRVTPLGFLPNYYTGTGFRMTPVVALVDRADDLVPNPEEVERVFTTPLSVLFNMDRYRLDSLVWEGRRRQFYVVDQPGAHIWGATAALCRILFERLRDA
ncbi:MAG: CoA pyrophosphatase [Proteobacteria bacterium]|nr:CoA pyrophosphatase [Pseudomonadota bacterium]